VRAGLSAASNSHRWRSIENMGLVIIAIFVETAFGGIILTHYRHHCRPPSKSAED
jgi:hypothetical protein